MLLRPQGSLGPVRHLDLPQDRFDMNFDGRFCQPQLSRNHLVRGALGDEMQDLSFATGQALSAGTIVGWHSGSGYSEANFVASGLRIQQSQAHICGDKPFTEHNQLKSQDESFMAHRGWAQSIKTRLEGVSDSSGIQVLAQENHPDGRPSRLEAVDGLAHVVRSLVSVDQAESGRF
jgi:hypothetical protein